MKGMDIFCASQAATAICLSMEELASPSSNVLLGSTSPAIDRYNPIIRDSRRTAATTTAAPPLPPLTHKNRLKKKNKKLPPSLPLPTTTTTITKQNVVGDQPINKEEINIQISNKTSTSRKSWSCTKPGDFISPPGSTRYLLSEKVLLNALSDFDPPLKVFPAETSKTKDVDINESCDGDAKPPASSPSPSPSPSPPPEQVVVLRVSLHCRGCERKMRKHISRMEGVRSFNIDFAAKKVTVTGNVTPLEVLSSISKVKNAQLWAPTISEFKSAAAAAWVTDKGGVVGVAS